MNKLKAILGTAIGVSGTFAALGAFAGAMAQAVAPGAQIFATKCQLCHSVDRSKGSAMAPNLAGVVGRKAGSLPRFAYSPALVRSNMVWNTSNLDAFVASPQRTVRGTRMAFTGIPNAKDRAVLITYLMSKK